MLQTFPFLSECLGVEINGRNLLNHPSFTQQYIQTCDFGPFVFIFDQIGLKFVILLKYQFLFIPS